MYMHVEGRGGHVIYIFRQNLSMSLDLFTGLDQLTSELKGSSSLPSRVMLTGMCHWTLLFCVF